MKNNMSVFYLTRIAMLSAISFVLMIIEIPLPFFPSFYKLDVSFYPVLIGTFSMGTPAGIAILFVKDVLKALIKTSSMGVGEIADFCMSIFYILPAGFIYRKFKTKKGAICATITGSASASVASSILNYFVFIPWFARVFGAPVDAFVDMGNAICRYIKDLPTLIVFATLPFNVLKWTIVTVLTIFTYKMISRTLLKKPREKL